MKDFQIIIAVSLFVLAGIFVVIYFLVLESRKKRRIIWNQLCYLDIHSVFSPFTLKYRGNFEGFDLSFEFISAGKHTPPYIKIKFQTIIPFNLKVIKKTTWTKLGVKIGIFKEIKTGNPEFDAEFLVSAGNDLNMFSYLCSTEIQNAIKELFLMEFEYFQIKSGIIEIKKPYEDLEYELQQKKTLQIMRMLQLLSKR